MSASRFAETFDAITVEQLRATRASKWALPDGAIGAFVAEMDFGTTPAVIEALHREADRGSFGYAAEPLVEDLRAATAERLATAHDWHINPADVHPVPDVITVLEQAIATVTDPCTPVVVPTPAYMNFFNAVRNLGREVIEVPMRIDAEGLHRLDLVAIADAIESSGAQLVILCNPHNPTGRVMTREELEAFSRMIEAAGVRVFADEIWAPLTFGGRPHIPYASISPAAASHTITAVAASKGWNIPGLKCAQAVLSNDQDREIWGGMVPPIAHRTSTIGMAGTIAAYRDDSGWIEEVRDYLEVNTRIVHDAFAATVPAAHVGCPQGTYVSWIDLAELSIPGSPTEFIHQRAGVVPTDGTLCGEPGRTCIRFIAAMPRPILEQAVERMTAALASL